MTAPAWTVIIDDDPTGSQVVHGIEAVFGTEPDEVLDGVRTGEGRCFVLTNSRSLPVAEAVAATEAVATTVLQAAPGGRVRLISRGDSTLRGHVYAEVEALQRVREQLLGRRHDAVLFVPAFPQAGRTTMAGVHRAHIDGVDVPVAETEFARDATFGYSTSRMTEFVAEVSGGRILAADVLHLDLADVRAGAERVAELLATAGGRWVTADSLVQSDLDALAAGALLREEAGDAIAYRTGPAMVPSLLGIDGEHVVGPEELRAPPGANGHGLVVVGSHTAVTTRQVELAVAQHAPVVVELDVPGYLAASDRDAHLDDLADQVSAVLRTSAVVLMTSRARVDGTDAESSLALARDVSAGVSGLLRRIVARVTPRWVVLKGGITSHDGAVHGLEASRARILGQVHPGQIGVLRAEIGPLAGGSFVVFPGNVGSASALADTIALLDAAGARPTNSSPRKGTDMTDEHQTETSLHVGWIGLGAMGLPMASVLLDAGVPVTTYDLSAGAVASAHDRGAVPADNAAAAAAGADVLVVMVATPDQLESVLFGAGAVAAELAPGSVVLIASTVGPAVVESLAERLALVGVSVVDAPVSGGVARAGSGDLLFLVSGPSAARARVHGLIGLMARESFEFGDAPGAGQRVKLVNQLLCGVHIAAAAEALAYAESLGLDAATCHAAIRTGAAASFMLDDRGQRMLEPVAEVRSAVDIFVKDLGLVAGAATDSGAVTDLARTALAMFEDSSAAGLGRQDDSRLIDRLRDRSTSDGDR